MRAPQLINYAVNRLSYNMVSTPLFTSHFGSFYLSALEQKWRKSVRYLIYCRWWYTTRAKNSNCFYFNFIKYPKFIQYAMNCDLLQNCIQLIRHKLTVAMRSKISSFHAYSKKSPHSKIPDVSFNRWHPRIKWVIDECYWTNAIDKIICWTRTFLLTIHYQSIWIVVNCDS